MSQASNYRYYATAGILSLGWLGVLMIPGWTRAWFIGTESSWAWNALFLIGTGLMLAKWFRSPIGRARTFSEHLHMAIVVPYIGSMAYLTIYNIWIWVHHWLFGGLATIHDTMSLYVLGFSAAVMAFFVIIPYGLLCQWLMNKVAT
jgi:hypothetical protein